MLTDLLAEGNAEASLNNPTPNDDSIMDLDLPSEALVLEGAAAPDPSGFAGASLLGQAFPLSAAQFTQTRPLTASWEEELSVDAATLLESVLPPIEQNEGRPAESLAWSQFEQEVDLMETSFTQLPVLVSAYRPCEHEITI